MNYLLFNPLDDNNSGNESAAKAADFLKPRFPGLQVLNIVDTDIPKLIAHLTGKDLVIILGGDGTLNHLINRFDPSILPCPFYCYPNGTGNDFLNDVREKLNPETNLVRINEYLSSLPTIEVNGMKKRFLNGIGFGIDGECCKVAEDMKKEQQKTGKKRKIDYGKITVHLLLTSYKPRTCTVTINGETHTFPKTYLASCMNGRYYGGGMMIAPSQKRGTHFLTSVVIHGKGRLGTLIQFPSFFKGKHVKYKKNTSILSGPEMTVRFDKPTSLQIDGEVVENVLEYKAYAK